MSFQLLIETLLLNLLSEDRILLWGHRFHTLSHEPRFVRRLWDIINDSVSTCQCTSILVFSTCAASGTLSALRSMYSWSIGVICLSKHTLHTWRTRSMSPFGLVKGAIEGTLRRYFFFILPHRIELIPVTCLHSPALVFIVRLLRYHHVVKHVWVLWETRSRRRV